jgi:hypothetical protein
MNETQQRYKYGPLTRDDDIALTRASQQSPLERQTQTAKYTIRFRDTDMGKNNIQTQEHREFSAR